MTDPSVSRWKQRGRTSLWRYTTIGSKWRGWHLAADSAGCLSMLELMSLLENAQYPGKATVVLAKPTAAVLNVPNRKIHEAKAAETWTLIYPKADTDPRLWEFSSSGLAVTLRFGAAHLPVLRKVFQDVAEANGDYYVPRGLRDGDPLWAWWWSGA